MLWSAATASVVVCAIAPGRTAIRKVASATIFTPCIEPPTKRNGLELSSHRPIPSPPPRDFPVLAEPHSAGHCIKVTAS